jgi:hypothetical protein
MRDFQGHMKKRRLRHIYVKMFLRYNVSLEAELRTLLAPGFKGAIDDAIINLLNTTVRQIILEGSPDLDIPVLDPIRLDHVDLDVNLDSTVQ